VSRYGAPGWSRARSARTTSSSGCPSRTTSSRTSTPAATATRWPARWVVEDTEIGDSYLRHSPTLYNFELASFTERLRALQREGSGQAVLGDADAESGDEFGLTISLSDGTGTLAGFVGNKAGARLGFGPIDIDHSFVADALALFDDIIETFPPFAATSPPTEPRHQRGWESILDRRSPGESCQLRH
jgi:hypothetical protein